MPVKFDVKVNKKAFKKFSSLQREVQTCFTMTSELLSVQLSAIYPHHHQKAVSVDKHFISSQNIRQSK